MTKFSWIILLLFLCSETSAQDVQPAKLNQVLNLFSPDSGLWVINAWATYCKPCLEEMPLFAKADSLYAVSGVHFVFLSFDFTEDSNRINRIIRKHRIPGSQFVIDETDMNRFINAVDSAWSGALPATWFISAQYRKPVFYGFRQFDDIKHEIDDLISASNEN